MNRIPVVEEREWECGQLFINNYSEILTIIINLLVLVQALKPPCFPGTTYDEESDGEVSDS